MLIDLFTDSDTILITSLFTMHCGLSSVYKYLLSGKKTCKQGGKKYTYFGSNHGINPRRIRSLEHGYAQELFKRERNFIEWWRK